MRMSYDEQEWSSLQEEAARQATMTPDFDGDNVLQMVQPLAPKLKASPFVWRPTAEIPPRQWLYGRHLLRKFVSVDVAAGGVGKSSVKIGEAVAMASGQSIYGKDIGDGPLRVWLYNLEDPMEETERRIHATCQQFFISPDDIGDRLYVNSGRDQRCVIAEETQNGARIIVPVVDQIIAEITEHKIDVLIIDPFVSSHDVSENDNKAMDLVVKKWGHIADVCNCSINLVHHIRKTNGTEATADSSRGAKALTDGARSVMVYNRMTKEEAQEAAIKPEHASFYFRTVNDKANLSPPEAAEWYRMNNVDLENGDEVGVACRWEWPNLFDGLSVHHLKEVQRAISEGEWRLDVRSKGAWVGACIGQALGWDWEEAGAKKKITRMVGTWVKNGALLVVEKGDKNHEIRNFVEVGQWVIE